MTPDEIALLVTLLQTALTEGKDLYDASQLKAMADLLVKLQAQLAETQQDRLVANTNVAARDKEIEDELSSAK
jgi:hypothetical protein